MHRIKTQRKMKYYSEHLNYCNRDIYVEYSYGKGDESGGGSTYIDKVEYEGRDITRLIDLDNLLYLLNY